MWHVINYAVLTFLFHAKFQSPGNCQAVSSLKKGEVKWPVSASVMQSVRCRLKVFSKLKRLGTTHNKYKKNNVVHKRLQTPRKIVA